MILKSLIGAGLLWVVLCSNGFAESTLGKGEPNYTAVAHDLVPTDTTVQTGTLPNGLRFALLHADHPKGGLSIRLGIDVGSFEEADDERGVAHFIEHMAFRSTRSYPDNSVDGAFTAAGVEFGRDHNAATDLFSTQFELDLPRATGAERNRAFTWLRDVADGVVFDLAAVDKERGVVLAEKEARNNEAQAAYDALQQFQAPGLRAFDRSAIGTDAVLKGVSAETLKAFYRRWYRPDNAIVVVVGDLTIDEMKVDIERAFGSWSVSGPKPERATYGALDTTRRLDTFTRADDSNFASIDVCRFSPSLPKTRWDYDRVRQEALRKIARQIINQRLLQSRLVAANQILGAQLSSEEDRDHRSICLSIKPTNGAWVPALAAGQAELLRFQKSGPTEFELEQAIDAVRAPLRGAISEADGRAAPILADDILSKMLDGEPLPEPRQRLRAYDLAVEHVTVADVRTAFDADWAGSGPLVSVIEPTAPTPAEVRQAWRANEQGSGLAAYTDLKPLTWGYAFGPPGETVSREHVMLGDFARFRFRNGVVLNFKRTQFRKRYASFVISFGSGRREIEKKDFLTAMIGGVIAVFGGVGKYSYEDLTRLTQSDLRTLAIHTYHSHWSRTRRSSRGGLRDRRRVVSTLGDKHRLRSFGVASLSTLAPTYSARVLCQLDQNFGRFGGVVARHPSKRGCGAAGA